MRKFKFRIWDEENNCFFKPTYEAYKGRLEDLSIGMSGELMMRTYDKPAIHESLFPERFIIQQYTGLTDKNGVEIYEGDIVKRPYVENLIFTGDVVFVDGMYRIAKDLGEDGIEYAYLANHCHMGGLEVIGNIYEHSHLLEKP